MDRTLDSICAGILQGAEVTHISWNGKERSQGQLPPEDTESSSSVTSGLTLLVNLLTLLLAR